MCHQRVQIHWSGISISGKYGNQLGNQNIVFLWTVLYFQNSVSLFSTLYWPDTVWYLEVLFLNKKTEKDYNLLKVSIDTIFWNVIWSFSFLNLDFYAQGFLEEIFKIINLW